MVKYVLSITMGGSDMEVAEIRELIDAGKTAIGIEFGSTRIKAVMVDNAGKPIAQGSHGWENQ